MRVSAAFACGVALGGLTLAAAQTGGALAFDTASVRQSSAEVRAARQVIAFRRPGSLTISNMSLREIIAYAFGYDPANPGALPKFARRIRGGESALLSTRFDIVAKAPEGGRAVDNLRMLRTLLVERFGLRFHYQQVAEKGLAMTLVKPGSPGPWLKPSRHDCAALLENGVRVADLEARAQQLCQANTEFKADGVQVKRHAGTMTVLATELEGVMLLPVVDETGLTGLFEWEVTFANRGDGTSEYAPIYTAVREQLGLNLKPRVVEVEALVIDGMHMPTDN